MQTDKDLNIKVREQAHSEWSEIPYINGSIVYGSIAVRSLFILSGGALFLFPALMNADKGNAIQFLQFSAPFFLISVILAGLTCLFAYINLQELAEISRLHAHHEHIIRFAIIQNAEEEHINNLLESRDKDIKEPNIIIIRYERMAIASVCLGYALFFLGCILSAFALN